MNDALTHYYNGQQYVTRKQIAAFYGMPQTCLQRRLVQAKVRKVVEGTRFYFLLADIEKIFPKN